MTRIVMLVEIEDDEDELAPDEMECVKFVEIRQYDMNVHEQCAIQFVREMVMQGRTPEPDRQRIIVIGGDMLVTTLEDAKEPIPVSRVPFTVWVPVPPPPTPQWSVKEA